MDSQRVALIFHLKIEDCDKWIDETEALTNGIRVFENQAKENIQKAIINM
ncbi:MAG: hypothetical protein JKX98_01270 [Alcanivoracaceae bacterium]|nr:hypothetical protein [Alcanivoracaceae bacterium]